MLRTLERWDMRWVLLLAMVARLAYLAVSGTLLQPEPWEYEDEAHALLAGEGIRYHHWGLDYLAYGSSVLHPAVAALVYAVTGHSHTAFVVVQALISTLTVWVVHAIGARTVGRTAAILGAVLAAVHPPSLVYVGKLHPLGIDSLMTTACLFGTLYLERRKTLPAAVMLGALFGLGALTRPTVGLFLPVALVWLLWRGQGAGGLARLVAIGAIAVAIVLPWTARNTYVLGEVVAVSSTSTENFWRGNNPRSTGGALTLDRQPILEVAPEEFKQTIFAANEVQRYHLFEQAALEYIAADPVGFLQRTATKFLYFWWFAPETGLLYEPLWLDVYRVLYGAALLLAAVGVWNALSAGTSLERVANLLVLVLLVEISLAQSLFYVEGRHRWLIEPVLMLYSARGLVALWDSLLPRFSAVGSRRPLSSPTE